MDMCFLILAEIKVHKNDAILPPKSDKESHFPEQRGRKHICMVRNVSVVGLAGTSAGLMMIKSEFRILELNV